MTRNPLNRVSIAIASTLTALALVGSAWNGIVAFAGEQPSPHLLALSLCAGIGAGIAWLLCD